MTKISTEEVVIEEPKDSKNVIRGKRFKNMKKITRVYAAFFISQNSKGKFNQKDLDKLYRMIDEGMDKTIEWVDSEEGFDFDTVVRLWQ